MGLGCNALDSHLLWIVFISNSGFIFIKCCVINPAVWKRVASQQSPCGHHNTSQRSISRNRIYGILRAGWVVLTTWSKIRRDKFLIAAQECDQNKFHLLSSNLLHCVRDCLSKINRIILGSSKNANNNLWMLRKCRKMITKVVAQFARNAVSNNRAADRRINDQPKARFIAELGVGECVENKWGCCCS